LSAELERKLAACMGLPALMKGDSGDKPRLPAELLGKEGDRPAMRSFAFAWGTLLGWLPVHSLGKIAERREYAELSRSWIDEWLLGKLLLPALQEFGLSEDESWRSLALIKILTSHQNWFAASGEQPGRGARGRRILARLLADREVQAYLQVNRYQDVLWYNAESFGELVSGLRLTAAVEVLAAAVRDKEKPRRVLQDRLRPLDRLEEASSKSEYRVERLLELSLEEKPAS
jgi:hypothetical protein